MFLLIFVVMLGHYGPNDLSVGMVGVAAFILALFIAAFSTFLNLILTFFPDLPFSVKRSGWCSIALAWGTLLILSLLR